MCDRRYEPTFKSQSKNLRLTDSHFLGELNGIVRYVQERAT
jgi:hypothetical protein